MKRKLIAFAVASICAPAVAMADITIYGVAHMSVDSNSGNGTSVTGATQDGTRVASNSSRLGFKGSTDLDNGMKAFFQYESGVDMTSKGNGTDGNGNRVTNSMFTTARDSFIGLGGDFGKVMLGRLPLANQYVYDVNFFADQVGDAGNFAIVGNMGGAGYVWTGGRADNAISYTTPNLNGFSGLVTYIPNSQQSAGASATAGSSANKQSSYTLRGTYSAGPIFAAASYQNLGVAGFTPTMLSGAEWTVGSIAATYNYGVGMAGVEYTSNGVNSAANNGGASTTQSVVTAGANFKITDRGTVKGQFSKANSTSGATNGGSMIAVGYDHSVNKDLTLYVAVAKVSNDANASFSATGWGHGGVGAPAVAGVNPAAISVGEVYAF